MGGIAVGAYGYPHATDDVDWLVTEEGAFSGTVVVTFKPGIPIRSEDVAIDYLTPEGPQNVLADMRASLERSASDPYAIVVASPALLVWMKLRAGRAKDVAAVVEMLKSGAVQAWEMRRYVEEAGDALVAERFLRCARRAGADVE